MKPSRFLGSLKSELSLFFGNLKKCLFYTVKRLSPGIAIDRFLSRGVKSQIVCFFLFVALAFFALAGFARCSNVDFLFSKDKPVQPDGIELAVPEATHAAEPATATIIAPKRKHFGSYICDALDVFMEAVDMNQDLPGWHYVLAVACRLVGAVLLGGMLISTLSNVFDRRIEKWTKGLWGKGWLCRPKLIFQNHYVVIGNGEEIVELVEAILEGDVARISDKNCRYNEEPVVILTHGDVETLRERIFVTLKNPIHQWNLFFIYGDLEFDECLKNAHPEQAKTIFVLGDSEENFGRDVRNLSSMAQLRKIIGSDADKKTPVFVQFDGVPAYSIIQKLECFSQSLYGMDSRPFNLFENWARLLWGFYGKRWTAKEIEEMREALERDLANPKNEARKERLKKQTEQLPKKCGDYAYRSLAYRPIREDSNDYVHLVVVGFGQMGQALVLEALRICHYANFKETDSYPKKTKITIIDRNPEAELFFRAQCPYLEQIYDIDLRFETLPVESPKIRNDLAQWAKDKHCLLTIAVCLSDPDMALAVGLNLPEEVYEHYDEEDANKGKGRKDASGKTIECLEEKMKKGGNTVLIRQSVYGEIGRAVNRENDRYKYVQTFGEVGKEFDAELLRDEIPKLIHHLYDTNAMHLINKVEDIEEKIKTDKESIDKKWIDLEEYIRWSNRFQADSYRVYLEYLGMTTRKSAADKKGKVASLPQNPIFDSPIFKNLGNEAANDNEKERLLHNPIVDMEHRRWVAERTLAGLRAWRTELPFCLDTDKKTIQNKIYRRHSCIRTTEKILGSALKEGREVCLKDCYPVHNMPYLLAHDGYDVSLKTDKTDEI